MVSRCMRRSHGAMGQCDLIQVPDCGAHWACPGHHGCTVRAAPSPCAECPFTRRRCRGRLCRLQRALLSGLEPACSRCRPVSAGRAIPCKLPSPTGSNEASARGYTHRATQAYWCDETTEGSILCMHAVEHSWPSSRPLSWQSMTRSYHGHPTIDVSCRRLCTRLSRISLGLVPRSSLRLVEVPCSAEFIRQCKCTSSDKTNRNIQLYKFLLYRRRLMGCILQTNILRGTWR